jgi:hypothetical protein
MAMAEMLAGATPFQQAMIEAQLDEYMEKPGPCTLCGVVVRDHIVSFYKPPQAQELGAAPGKARMFFNYLCPACQASGGVERLENQMFEHYRLKRLVAEAAAAGVEIFS